VFKVAFSLYRVWITKEEVVRLQCLYQVFKVALSMNPGWITKQEVIKLRSLVVQVFKVALSLY